MTSGHSYATKLQPPAQLPEQGFTALQWKPWKNLMMTFLQQFPQNVVFLPAPPRQVAVNRLKEGIYDTWRPSASWGIYGRIENLHARDKATPTSPRARELGITRGAYNEVTNEWNRTAADLEKQRVIFEELDDQTLIDRNRDLGLLLTHISNCCFVSEADDVSERSTSLNWIWDYLQKHYDIAPKGANFLKIASLVYTSDMQPYTFYKQFRATFLDNLRKAGAKDDARWGDARLDKDERLSPSFEDAIILWALEKIDPRLPAQVKKEYEHQLSQDSFLSDLHPRILQGVPSMLEGMEKPAAGASISTAPPQLMPQPYQPYQPFDYLDPYHMQAQYEADLHAFQARGGRGWGGRGGRGSQPPFRAPPPPRGGKRIWHTIYCGKCKEDKKPLAVYTSHMTAECSSVPNADKKEAVRRILASMTLADDQYQGSTYDYPDQHGPGLGDYDHQEGTSPQGPPNTTS